MTGEEILNIKMVPNDADAETIRDYLKALLNQLWMEDEGFSGKRPFGNSGWQHEIYNSFDECDDIPEDTEYDPLVFLAISAL